MAKAINIFISYSVEDEALAGELIQHLNGLKKQGVVEIYDRSISVDAGFLEFERDLASADIVLLLVSPDFLASDFLHHPRFRYMMRQNEEGGTVVVPVILRPSAWWEELPLENFQALPRDAQPITAWNDRDLAFQDVVQRIERVARRKLATIAQPELILSKHVVSMGNDSNQYIGRDQYISNAEKSNYGEYKLQRTPLISILSELLGSATLGALLAYLIPGNILGILVIIGLIVLIVLEWPRVKLLLEWIGMLTVNLIQSPQERRHQKGPERQPFWDKLDRIAVITAGGAALGGAIGQIPGAIAGAVIASLYGWYITFA